MYDVRFTVVAVVGQKTQPQAAGKQSSTNNQASAYFDYAQHRNIVYRTSL